MLNINRLQLQDISKMPTNSLVAKVASAIAVFVGSLVLVGWCLGIEVLKRGFPGSPATMKVNTALCFVLCGVSLSLFLKGEQGSRGAGKQRSRGERTIQNYPHSSTAPLPTLTLLISQVCAIAVTTIVALTLCEYLFGWNLGIDELVFRDSRTSIATLYPGRMGVNTALNFILVSVALEILIHPKTHRSYWYAQIIALIATLISFQALMGYAYKVKVLYGLAPYTTSMALHTAVLFLLLSMGILWVRADQGLMRVVTSDSYGGLLARRLLIAAIAVPFILGWVIVEGQRAGQYDPAFAVSVFAIVLIVIFTILIWQSARVIERLSYQRDLAQKALRTYEAKLGSFVDANVIGILFGDVDGGIQQANDELLRMIGYTREDLLAGRLSWRNITPPEYLYLDERGVAEAQGNTNAACTPYEKEFICKDGSRIPVLVGYVLLGENREESVAFILDLSERKQAEAEQQKLASLVENSSDFIGIATLEGQLLYINDAGQKLVGFTNLSEVRQKAVLDYFMPKDKAYFQEYILPTVLSEGCWQGEFCFRHLQTGQPIPVDYNIFTVTDNNTGQPIALATVTRDISEQKQAKEQILQLNRDLQRRITELQTLLEVIPIGIGIAEDPECQNIKVNPAFGKQLGISSDTNGSLNAPVDERPTSFKIYREGRELSTEELPMQYSATHGVEILDCELDVVHENGKIVKLLYYVAPLFDEEGKTRGSVGAFLDITERKQAEEVLLNQQKWLEDVLNLMPRPLLFIEPGTARVTFANRSADELAGGEFPKGVPAVDYHTVYHYTDAIASRIPNELMPGVRVARGERLNGLEVDWHTPAGVRSLLVFADTLPAMHGHPATCILVFQEISNLKQAEKALSLGYKRLKLLFDTANDLLSSQEPVLLIDSVYQKLRDQIGLDIYFNYLVEDNSQVMRLESYSGISQEMVQEVEWLTFGQGVSGGVALSRHPIAVENVQQSTDLQTELIRSLGITAYYAYPLLAQGRLLGTLSFGSRTLLSFTDNQKGMMQAVCDQIAIAMERASLIAFLQQQTEQLQEANRMKDEFLGILSHELRSPLNAILGWAQLLQRSKLSDTQMARATETIERNAKAQTQLIEDLLDISRMSRGKLRLDVRTCNLVLIIESAIETVSLAAQSKEIDLRFSLIPSKETRNAPPGILPVVTIEPNSDWGLGVNRENLEFSAAQSQINQHSEDSKLGENSQFLVSGDFERLQQIIWNLLSNAIKFTPVGGRVEVQLSVISGQEKQQTTDKYAQIQVIDTGIGISPNFLPYVFDRFRQADSSNTRIYGGLGLGLAIVRHLVELHGGTVHVNSPGEQQGATFTVKLPLLKNSSLLSLLGVRVLVVDEQADTREFITTVLEQYQAEVKAVASVSEALQLITQWKPNALVSDISMPQEDGYSLIHKVRSQPPELGGNIPAAALTDDTKEEDRLRAIQEGYQLHLPKPIKAAELATVIASLVGRT
ncbi:hybrid sensor histidine kinase/response regulator [Nostoc sp. 'Lobaria pulmonaria (5183) cyanobiont']|uniref:hybrid sensor histidine kinase/response regulator n=1 Tax=Nostoc sp. 'Lobaria pulmonaria (5183) cyanobiont' TaxID=1618022 RepID=UPI000CF309C5|nr:PAS domain S-box protein [Nostoc sp. 'Lobaria pulmonaria (5183) cyanobiont']AVH69958.1 histidine kinase [Nostoc sp. 'Lobaria pulmonaria (5183) cyanobiont']